MNLQNFSFFLTDQLLKGVAILMLAGLASLALRRASAAKLSAIWCSAFIALLLLPLTRLVAPLWAWNPDSRATVATPASDFLQLAPASVSSTASIASSQTITPTRPRFMLFVGTEGLMMLWAGGATFLLLRRAIGSWQWQRLLRRSKAAEAGPLLATFQEALARYPLRRPVCLRISSTCLVPVTCGARRPVILLPAEAEDWPISRCRIVLGHELAHIRRGDFATRTLTCFVCALHWCNPLVWLAARRLRLVQEQACDDLVLGSGTDAAEYATELVLSVRRFQRLPLAFRQALAMAQPSTLEIRVRAVMNESRDRGLAGRWLVLASAVTVPLLLAGSALAQVAPIDRPASPPNGANVPAGNLPENVAANVLITKEWRFPLLAARKLAPAANWEGNDRGQGAMKALLETRGVSFTGRALIVYRIDTSTLVVRNTRSNLDVVDQIVSDPAGQLSAAELEALEALETLEAQRAAADPSFPIQKKAKSLIIPQLELREATVQAAIDFLVRKAREMDPEKKGVEVTFAPGWNRPEPSPGGNPNESRITISLKNIPLGEALRYITHLANLNLEYNKQGITILPQAAPAPAPPADPGNAK